MEIRKVEKNIANYPKKNEIEKSEIKGATPKKWVFSAMLLSVIDFVGGSVFASETIYSPVLSGLEREEPIVLMLSAFTAITLVIAPLMLIAAILDILYTKIKKEEHKISKGQKIFIVIPLVLLALRCIAIILIHIYQNYCVA